MKNKNKYFTETYQFFVTFVGFVVKIFPTKMKNS